MGVAKRGERVFSGWALTAVGVFGVAWLYPWRAAVVGGRWVPFEYWIWSDVIFVLWAWFLNRALKRAEARSARVSQQSD